MFLYLYDTALAGRVFRYFNSALIGASTSVLKLSLNVVETEDVFVFNRLK